MKVERGRAGSAGTGGTSKAEPKRAGDVSFAEAVTAATDRAVEKDRDRLIALIDEQAAVLEKKRTVAEMTKFRDLVTDFMKLVMKDSFEMKEIPSAHYRTNGKIFLIARRIEDKLLELAEKVRAGAAKAIDITASTSEIRGLLMDLKA